MIINIVEHNTVYKTIRYILYNKQSGHALLIIRVRR